MSFDIDGPTGRQRPQPPPPPPPPPAPPVSEEMRAHAAREDAVARLCDALTKCAEMGAELLAELLADNQDSRRGR